MRFTYVLVKRQLRFKPFAPRYLFSKIQSFSNIIGKIGNFHRAQNINMAQNTPPVNIP